MQNIYWHKKGKHQKEADTVTALVPDMGMADTMHIEAVRITVNAYYDFYNNAGCNERIEELSWVYDWLEKHEVEHEPIGRIDYAKLYRNFHKDDGYADRIGEKLERIADAVFMKAYEIEAKRPNKNHIYNWIISEAWTLLEPREDEHAVNWRGYVEQHAPEMLGFIEQTKKD